MADPWTNSSTREKLWRKHRFWLCVHCGLDLSDMTLGQGHDTPLCHGQQLCEIISKSKKSSKKLWPGHGFWLYVHCDLDLGDMTLGQGYDTPLGHRQQMSEVSFKSKLPVKSDGPDMEFGYVYTVTLTLEL